MFHQQEFQPDRRRRFDDLPEMPEGRPMLLLSAVYSGEEKKVYLKFYDPTDNTIFHWRDRTDHKPYCYTKMEFAEQAQAAAQKETKYKLERVRKRDIISDKEIEVLKVVAPDPLSIGGTDTSFREKVPSWEADIKYHENYLYDRSLIPGLYYIRKDEKITPFEYPISEKVQFALKSLLWDKIKETGESGKEYRQYITNWANLLNQPVPELKRVALDIEVETEEGRMPNPRDHDRRVSAVGFVASDGFRKVLVLGNNTPSTGEQLIPEAEACNTEKELLEKTFRIINEYPIVITFNGDDFDLPYLYARSQDPRIDPSAIAIPKDKVPIMVKKESFIKRGMQAEAVGIRHGIHIDLYRTFDNRSIQIYAFSRAYTEHTLNAICEALLNDTKIEFEGDISELPIQRLAEYCLKDADLTYRLTSFNDNLLMKLLVVISRIGRLSVDDIARFGVNQWIRGILYYEHRQRNELIPSRSELEAKGSSSTAAIIKEKKYRGGEVVEPLPGIHFGAIVLDFACFDDQTEILTKDGWKNYDTLKQGDIGLSVNLDTGEVEEDPIGRIFRYDIDDIVFRIKTPRKLDFIFTPNHRMVYRIKKGGNNWIWKDRLEVKPLNEISNYHYSLPCFGKWNGKVRYYQTIGHYTFDTNTWLEFIGRFIGDGSFGTRSIQISENISHRDKIDGLCAIIKKLGFDPHIYQEGTKNSVNIAIHNKQFTDALRSVFGIDLNCHSKYVPKCYLELSSEHLQYLLKGLMESDGSTHATGEKTFATVSKQLADDFQLLALKCGYNCVVTPRISNGYGGKYRYYLCILSGFRNKKASFVVSRQNPNHVSKEHFSGKVWCASTRNTTVIIRRKGRVIVTGNSLYPSIIKVHNLSYETINCPHDDCRELKIEGTDHWVCRHRKGLASLLIGSLRDLRVNYYKNLAKDKTLPPQERQLYTVVSQAIKVILNAAYGVMGAEIFPLYCLPVADATAALGRSTINRTINKCKEIGVQVVYGDSVLPDTPIIIRRKDKTIDIVPIESLMPRTVKNKRYDAFGDLEVLTDSGFNTIKYIYRHKVKKKGYRILTRKAFVECTQDHSLIIKGKKVKPTELKVGDKIDLVPFKTESHVNINPDLAWLFGFFIAEGTCGTYRFTKPYPYLKYSWRIVNQDEGKLQRAKKVIQECLGLRTTLLDIRKSSATLGLVPKDDFKIFVDYFKSMCYRGLHKAIPQCVLNGNLVVKKSFIEGTMTGDGNMDFAGIVTLDQMHKTVLAGIVGMLEELRIEYSLQIREDKDNICRVRIIRDKTDKRVKEAEEIKKIEEFEIDDYVYDLETENHHFCGGIGNVILHNTDSIFVSNPDQKRVEELMQWAHESMGVDLEIDKQYRYVVFSELKKNYLGVMPDGNVDVKGLTGKKSHTPPFIRKAFYDTLTILGRVNTEKDFESAKESIKNVILENVKNLEARKIPLEDLSFNVTINKSLSSYGKKTASQALDGKGTDTYKGLPQHIKAAKMLVDASKRDMRAGDIISYVKIKNGEGVKPVELAKPEEIDTEKYLETMESTFEQVISALNFDFKSVLGKPRQQRLDELFWTSR